MAREDDVDQHETPVGVPGEATGASSDDDAPLDPGTGLAIVAAQQRRVRDSDVDERVMFGAWGLAWLIGYAFQWWTAATSPTGTSTARGGVVFGLVLLAALVVTIVHVGRATRGLAGTSRQVGALYGWAWAIGFTGQGLLLAGVVAAGADAVVIAIVGNGTACLIVGMLYLASGAMWGEISMYVIGAWMIATAGAASLVGMPGGYLVMSLGGGGGLLVGAVVAALRRRRR